MDQRFSWKFIFTEWKCIFCHGIHIKLQFTLSLFYTDIHIIHKHTLICIFSYFRNCTLALICYFMTVGCWSFFFLFFFCDFGFSLLVLVHIVITMVWIVYFIIIHFLSKIIYILQVHTHIKQLKHKTIKICK